MFPPVTRSAPLHNILLYGGTFDPIHNGHLQTALQVQQAFHFEKFLFLPCPVPLLKNKAGANPKDRLNMLELALSAYSPTFHFGIDLSELNRKAPTYMIETLSLMREAQKATLSLTLLIGKDVFHQLPQWHRWENLLNYCHLLVIDRPGISDKERPAVLEPYLLAHQTRNKSDLFHKEYGLIYLYQAGLYPFSSTQIREAVKKGHALTALVPKTVEDYIRNKSLYLNN